MAGPAASLTDFLQGLPISWLAGNPHGRADMGAQGALYDDQVDKLIQATQARMPSIAPLDALDHIGNDRFQFWNRQFETSDHFRERLRKAWNLWELAGTPVPLLIALYYAGVTDAVAVQQNGRWWQIAGVPDLDNPIACLTFGDTMDSPIDIPGPTGHTKGGIRGPVTTNLPSGDHPWWFFDPRWYFCSRFCLLFPSGWPIHFARIVFDGTSDTASANWSYPFNFGANIGEVHSLTITAGGPVTITLTFTETTVTAHASAPFTGFVDALGFIIGQSPFFSPSNAILDFLKKLIRIWKPAKATCVFIDFFTGGPLWGWPIGILWAGINPFDGNPLIWGAPTLTGWQQELIGPLPNYVL